MFFCLFFKNKKLFSISHSLARILATVQDSQWTLITFSHSSVLARKQLHNTCKIKYCTNCIVHIDTMGSCSVAAMASDSLQTQVDLMFSCPPPAPVVRTASEAGAGGGRPAGAAGGAAQGAGGQGKAGAHH